MVIDFIAILRSFAFYGFVNAPWSRARERAFGHYLVGHFRSSLTYFWGPRGVPSLTRSSARSWRVNFQAKGRAVVSQ